MTITLRALNDDDLNDIFRWESDPAAARMASFTLEGNRELTYWVDPSRWGRGIASGAVRLLILDEPRRPLYARAAEHNLGSRPGARAERIRGDR